MKSQNLEDVSHENDGRQRRKIKKAVEASRERLSKNIKDTPDESQQISKKRVKKRRKRVLGDEDVDSSVISNVRTKGKERLDENKENNSPERKNKKKREHSHEREYLSTEEVPKSKKRNVKEKKNRKTNRNCVTTSAEEEDGQEISDIFQLDKEDILQDINITQSSSSKLNVNTHHTSFVAPPPLSSQPNDLLYIEKKDGQGFLREHKSRVNKIQNRTTDYSIQLMDEDHRNTALEFMLGVHVTFRNIAMIGHGLLAGMAISQCIFVYVLSDISNDTFLKYYCNLALPYNSLYYFLLTLSTVSILDRFVNISSGWNLLIMSLLARPLRGLAILAYFLALVFSVSITQLDDKISLYEKLPSLWSDNTDDLESWKVMNLLRMVGAVIGWMLVAIAPVDDQTAKTIEAGIEKENTGGSTSTVRMELQTIT